MKTILLAEYGYFLLSNEYTQNREKEKERERKCVRLFFFTFHSFHLFMFDVRCWASISPVGCVRVSDVFFFFFDITCWASISLERMD